MYPVSYIIYVMSCCVVLCCVCLLFMDAQKGRNAFDSAGAWTISAVLVVYEEAEGGAEGVSRGLTSRTYDYNFDISW